MRLASFLLSVLLAALGSLPAGAATDPATPGAFAAGVVSRSIPVTQGRTLTADVYYPSAGGVVDPAAGLCPPVVFGHGFSRNKDRYTDVGTLLASRGFVAILPNFPCTFTGCDHSRNADDMIAVIDWILDENASPSSLFFGRIDPFRIGSSGHSAGGMWSLVAAGRDTRILAAAPMDPVDSGGLGAGALPGARAAVAITYSEPSSCNASGSAAQLYDAAPPQKRGVKLLAANHCDPEKSNDALGCALVCGAWNATRHARYLRYVAGWFEYYLHCDDSYHEWAWGSKVQADLGAGVVTYDAALAPPAPSSPSASWSDAVVVRRAPLERCAGVTGWRVYRSTSSGSSFSAVSGDLPLATVEWTDPSTAPGATYFYRLRHLFFDFLGAGESADSPEISVTTPPASTPGEASPTGFPLTARRGSGTAVETAFEPAPCATDHTVYWNAIAGAMTEPPSWTGQACALGVSGVAALDPGDPPAGGLVCFVVVGNDGAVEGSYGSGSSGAERPEATGLPGCDYPRSLSGSCP